MEFTVHFCHETHSNVSTSRCFYKKKKISGLISIARRLETESVATRLCLDAVELSPQSPLNLRAHFSRAFHETPREKTEKELTSFGFPLTFPKDLWISVLQHLCIFSKHELMSVL